MTLVEVMFAAAFIGAIMFSICWAMVQVSRVGAEETTASAYSNDSRWAFDSLRQDAIGSEAVLPTLTCNGVTYTSSPNGVLILQTPTLTYNANGTIANTYLDTIVYHLVGASAPYTLNRFVDPQSGSPLPVEPDTVVASNVQSLAITFTHHVTWSGTGSASVFALDIPAASTASGANSSIDVGGTAIAVGTGSGQAGFIAANGTYPNGAIQLPSAPASGVTIDAFYPVDSTQTAGAAGVSSLSFDMLMSSSLVVSGAPTTQSMEMLSTAKLRNY